MAGAIITAARQDWGTAPAFVGGVSSWFGAFDLDVAAGDHNAKAPRWYTEADDGLSQPWLGSWWCNPPWESKTAKRFVAKAIAETLNPGSRGVMLLPHKSEQPFWRDIWRHATAVLDVEGRMRFVGAASCVTVPAVLVVFGVDYGAGAIRGRVTRDGRLVRLAA
ncbi:MAG: phage N-6-adenine-methyltransferase [Myxococcota bacterium]|jgi:phage N-6-adenine-methyltransferase